MSKKGDSCSQRRHFLSFSVSPCKVRSKSAPTTIRSPFLRLRDATLPPLLQYCTYPALAGRFLRFPPCRPPVATIVVHMYRSTYSALTACRVATQYTVQYAMVSLWKRRPKIPARLSVREQWRPMHSIRSCFVSSFAIHSGSVAHPCTHPLRLCPLLTTL